MIPSPELPAKGIGKKSGGQVADYLLSPIRQEDALEPLEILEYLTTGQFTGSIDRWLIAPLMVGCQEVFPVFVVPVQGKADRVDFLVL